MLWALLSVVLASGLPLGHRELVPVLDQSVVLADLQISKRLTGSSFELESDANMKVDTSGLLDFSNAAANQFFLGETSDLVVTGSYRELVPTSNGVFFYIYWITQTPNQGITVQFRAQRDSLTPLDVKFEFNPTIRLVVYSLWRCNELGTDCSWGSPSESSWNLDPNTIAFFAYNSASIPGSQVQLRNEPSAPSWFLTRLANWQSTGLAAGLYAKGGIDLKKLPCYAGQQCADWNWIAITPTGSSAPISLFPFQNGYCSHINIQKSNQPGTLPLGGAVFGLYTPFGPPASLTKGAKVGECTTNSEGKCSIKTDPGTKLLFEDQAPVGYLPIKPLVVDIPSNGAMIGYALRDSEPGSSGLKIQKVSGATGAPVAGASFMLRQKLINGSVFEWTIQNSTSTFCTDYPPTQLSLRKFQVGADGCMLIDIIELKPPVGFKAIVLTDVKFCISTDPNKQECTSRAAITVRDQPTPLITLRKVGTEGISIGGTVLGLSETGDVNQDYSAIPAYARCTIPSSGSFCKLYAPTLGRYYVVEVVPPPRYNREAPQGPYDIVDGGSYDFTVHDTLTCYGAPTIQRLNCDGTPVDMSGAVYTVTQNGKAITFYGEDGYRRYCFANGTDLFPMDDSCCGDFTITEVTPPNGVPPAQPSSKELHYCGSSSGAPDCGERPVDMTFENPPCHGTFVVYKTGPYGTLGGVVFSLSNQEIGYSVSRTTGSDGVACWTEVPEGVYTLRETATINGYVLETGSRQVTVHPTSSSDTCQNPTASINIYNNIETGSIKIVKKKQTYPGYAGTSDVLSGATFLVKRVGSSWQRTVVIGSTGTECVQVEALATYTIQEIQAPPGYSLDPTIKTVTINDDSTCANTNLIFTFYDSEITTQPPPTTTTQPSTTTTQPPTTTTTPPPTTTTSTPTTTTCAPSPSPAPSPTPTPSTRPPRTTIPVQEVCGVLITVNGQRSYTGGAAEPLPGALLEILDINGAPLAPAFVMNSGTICVNIPLGSYAINQVSPPPSANWVSTNFPVRGECVTVSSCPQVGSSNTIVYQEMK